jgi:hypothetical protein
MALEEAFTPQLKSMLSAKLKEDEFGDEEDLGDEEGGEDFAAEEDEEFGGEEEIPAEEPAIAAPEEGDYGVGEDEFGGEEEIPVAAPEEQEDELGLGDEEGVVEINGVKYAPVVSEDEGEIGGEEEVDIEDDNLDLESIIRELEDELGDEEPVEEQDDAYDEKVGSTDASHLAEEDDAYDENVENVKNPESGVNNPMDGVSALRSEGEGDDEEEIEIDESLFFEGEDDDDDDLEENNDISSGIGGGDNKQPNSKQNSAQTEDPIDSTEVDDMNGVAALKSENREYKAAVRFLKNKLHEVNILNAKLLFTNKLFKEFALDNNQKLKVVETFDRTQSTREIKLVYSTLAEQFSDNGSIKNRKSINESASSKSGSTKPSKSSRKVITEESQVANRFKKLAGIING